MLLSSFIFLHRPIQGFQILDQKVTLKFQFDLYSSRLVHEYIRYFNFIKSKSNLFFRACIQFSFKKLSNVTSHNFKVCREITFQVIGACNVNGDYLREGIIVPILRHFGKVNFTYTIAILELLQYSSTLGMPDSVYAWFDIISNTCQPARCYLNSDKVFLLLSGQYRNPERGFEPGSSAFNCV